MNTLVIYNLRIFFSRIFVLKTKILTMYIEKICNNITRVKLLLQAKNYSILNRISLESHKISYLKNQTNSVVSKICFEMPGIFKMKITALFINLKYSYRKNKSTFKYRLRDIKKFNCD